MCHRASRCHACVCLCVCWLHATLVLAAKVMRCIQFSLIQSCTWILTWFAFFRDLYELLMASGIVSSKRLPHGSRCVGRVKLRNYGFRYVKISFCCLRCVRYAIWCYVNSSKKRVREEEEGSDSLPLSKRITLLHLDSNTRFASFNRYLLHLWNTALLSLSPHVGRGSSRKGPICFLAGWRKRCLNQIFTFCIR